MKNRMIVTKLIAKNWKNFREINIELQARMYVVGPNSSGKSNFLDIFRFLRDVAKPEGGLKNAIELRGNVRNIRCLAARQNNDVQIEIHICEQPVKLKPRHWVYKLCFRGSSKVVTIVEESVFRDGIEVLKRPNKADDKDPEQLTQTHLEQLSANQKFRPLANYFSQFSYLHLVPQLIRYAHVFASNRIPDDPFGQEFLQTLKSTSRKTLESRLTRIEKLLKHIIPYFEKLELVDDKHGFPHLQATIEHWRFFGNKQKEDQFSDGTLRLIGLFWALLSNRSLLLLEEPELSLHDAVIERLPSLFAKIIRKQKKNSIFTQIFLSTHSAALFHESGIDATEILMIKPVREGSEAVLASDIAEVSTLLSSGVPPADVIIPRTKPENIEQLTISF